MTPGLALLDNLRKNPKHKILWVGHKKSQTGDKNYSAEYREVKKREIKFISLHTGKVWRKWTTKTFVKGLVNLISIPIGFLHASILLIRFRPNIIFSFGGYLSVPVILNLPINTINQSQIFVHSQTIKPDLSTKLTSRFAKKIFVTWKESINFYPNKKTVLTGTPIRHELKEDQISQKLFANDLPLLLIIGGNQGANTFNRRLRAQVLEKYLQMTNIVHQTGASTVTNDYQIALSEKKHLPKNLESRYKVLPYIEAIDLNNIYNQTSLVLARSGANTVQEILYKGLPALFVPLPWAGGQEQLRNAQIAEKTGLAKIFEFYEGMTSEALFKKVKEALEKVHDKESFKKDTTWQEAKKKAKSLLIEKPIEIITTEANL